MHFEPWVVVVLIGTLCVVFSWFVKEPAGTGPAAADIEDALDLVTANLEEENRRLLDAMSAMKNEYTLRAQAWEAKAEALEKQVGALSEQVRLLRPADQVAPAAPVSAQPAELRTGPGGQGDGLSAAFERHRMEAGTRQAAQPAVSELRNSGFGASAPPDTIHSRYPELFRLAEEGKSVEQIARRIGLSKGETALILQLGKQEAEDHA
jgi:hypothetical protein